MKKSGLRCPDNFKKSGTCLKQLVALMVKILGYNALYYSYKGFYSIVLIAICDANYCFTLFDLGQYGSNNDSNILMNSGMRKMFDDDQLNVPADCKLSERSSAKR